MPFPLIYGKGGAPDSFDDHADSNAGIMDVPGCGAVIDALAGKLGQESLKRGFPC